MGGSIDDISDAKLAEINAERKRLGKSLLTREQVNRGKIESAGASSPGFDWFAFYLGYETGIPFPLTSEGMLGAALHQSPHHESDTSSAYAPPADPQPAYSTPSPDPTPSYDNSSSSSSSDSGTSNSGGD